MLARSFLAAACRDLERGSPLALSPAALDLLRRHTWPGNARELRNAMERAVVMCTEAVILPEHLPPALLAATRTVPSETAPSAPPGNLHAEVEALERRRIVEALERSDGNQSEAARQLGMPRRTLVARLKGLGITRRYAGPDESK